MKFASFRYGGGNLGDEIQSLAVEQHLPRVDTFIERDDMRSFEADEPHIVVMQGWFSEFPDRCFPPPRSIVPVFVGFHITEDFGAASSLLSGESLSYLKAHAPIGCRDQGTRAMLERAGASAYLSLCLTLTFPTRTHEPTQGRVFIVDASEVWIPPQIRAGAVYETQSAKPGATDEEERAEARRLLDTYRDEASVVITTKLHCALPCLAMGIPVVFFGDAEDYRYGTLLSIGQPIHPIRPTKGFASLLWRFAVYRRRWRQRGARSVDWNPPPLDLVECKRSLGSLIRSKLQEAVVTAGSLEHPVGSDDAGTGTA
jgi:hypothetical protein